MNSTRKIFRLILIILPIIFLIIVGYIYFSFSGTREFNYDFAKEKIGLQKITPSTRVEPIFKQDDNFVQKIVGEPVYFKAKTPVSYDQASLTFEFDPINQPVIDVGVILNKAENQIRLKPLYNQILENIIASDDWSKIQNNDLYLLTKNKNITSETDFWHNLNEADINQVAIYNYEINQKPLMANYKSSNKWQSYNYKLKGSHLLETYVNNETLNWQFSFENLDPSYNNQIIVYRNGEVIERYNLEGDANIQIKDLAVGYYQIKLDLSENTIINSWQTTQTLWSFKYELNLVDDKPIDLYSYSNKLYFQTFAKTGLQTAEINNQPFEILARNEQYIFDSLNYDSQQIHLESANLKINSTTNISFAKLNYLNSNYIDFRSFTDANQLNNFEYVVARYNQPIKLANGFWQNSLDLNVADAYIDRAKDMKFVISLPNLVKSENYILLNNISLKLDRLPIKLTNIWHKFISLWKN